MTIDKHAQTVQTGPCASLLSAVFMQLRLQAIRRPRGRMCVRAHARRQLNLWQPRAECGIR